MMSDFFSYKKFLTVAAQLPSELPHGLKGSIAQGTLIEPNTIAYIALAVLFVALLAAGLIRLAYRRRPQKKAGANEKNGASASQWASLKQLVNCMKMPVVSEDSQESLLLWSAFASDISLYLRRAIELKTGLPLAERTNQEIFKILKSQKLGLTSLTNNELMMILERLDEIRFARKPADHHEAAKLYSMLIGLIDNFERHDHDLWHPPSGVLPDNRIFD